ncbi:N-acetylmuramate alpha-1-phosphate uridylyltransferase MurU [Aurantivibrio plasticivorans]
MKAFIFAAGRGQRMGKLTDATPKPLLEVAGRPLIEYVIERIATTGIHQLVINLAYLGEQIADRLGDGSRYGVNIEYSREPYPLETGGGILNALPLLGNQPFLVINADVWCDMPLHGLIERGLRPGELGHLVLVDNPGHNPAGDFSWAATDEESPYAGVERLLGRGEGELLTYSGIAILHPRLVSEYPKKREVFPLLEAFEYAISKQALSGQYASCDWRDIGTPERLASLEHHLLLTK